MQNPFPNNNKYVYFLIQRFRSKDGIGTVTQSFQVDLPFLLSGESELVFWENGIKKTQINTGLCSGKSVVILTFTQSPSKSKFQLPNISI